MSSGYLPEDLMRDILSRTLVRSLLRFRCVRKSWNSLIKSSSFITTHLNNFNNKDHGLLLLIRDAIPKSWLWLLTNDTFDFHLEVELEKATFGMVVGTCNSLVCLYHYRTSEIILYNSSLVEQQKIIPPPNYSVPNPIWPSDKALGFGYDYINNDYKVVCWQGKSYSDQSTEVYSLGMNSWRKVETPDNITVVNCDYDRSSQAFLNGAIHWLGRHEEKNCGVVVSFNASSEVFQVFPQPDYDFEYDLGRNCSVEIEVYRDLLCVVSFGRRMKKWFCDIWVMWKYSVQDSWTRLHILPIESSNRKSLRGFGWNGELIWETAFSEFLTVEYPDNKTSKKMIKFPQSLVFMRVFTYTESLVLPEQ